MGSADTTISTHVLDTGSGLPAMNVPVRIARLLADGAVVPAGEGRTDIDGRIRSLLRGPLTPGVYRITFEVHEYRPQAFFREVTVEIRVDDVQRSYHVPLLLSPFGLTTYRGS